MAASSDCRKSGVSERRCEMAGRIAWKKLGDVLKAEDKPVRKKEKKPDGGKKPGRRMPVRERQKEMMRQM